MRDSQSSLVGEDGGSAAVGHVVLPEVRGAGSVDLAVQPDAGLINCGVHILWVLHKHHCREGGGGGGRVG